MIIGIAGLNCSGKDTAAALLEKEGFVHISLSDIIREEAKKRGMDTSRENLIFLGNNLRTTQGPEILAKHALEQIKPNQNYVITSIRNPAEVKTLHTTEQFTLISIETPIETRWQRMKKRQRTGDGNFEQFKQREEQELTSTNPTHQQLKKVIDLKDITISNNGTINELKKQIMQVLQHRKY